MQASAKTKGVIFFYSPFAANSWFSIKFIIQNRVGKMNATITISKEEIDRQFQYPGKNKVIKEYAETEKWKTVLT